MQPQGEIGADWWGMRPKAIAFAAFVDDLETPVSGADGPVGGLREAPGAGRANHSVTAELWQAGPAGPAAFSRPQ
jgi:hypothetical protein